MAKKQVDSGILVTIQKMASVAKWFLLGRSLATYAIINPVSV